MFVKSAVIQFPVLYVVIADTIAVLCRSRSYNVLPYNVLSHLPFHLTSPFIYVITGYSPTNSRILKVVDVVWPPQLVT